MFKSKLGHKQLENNEARRCLYNELFEFTKVTKNNYHVVSLILMSDVKFVFMIFPFMSINTCL